MRKILAIYLKVTLFLVPVFFLPLVVDSYGYGKNWLWLSMVLVGLLMWAVMLVTGKIEKVKINGAWLWLVALAVWATVFWWLKEPGVRIMTLMSTPGLGMVVAMLGWSFLWLQVKDEENEGLGWLTAAGILTAIVSLIIFLIPVSKMPISWPKDNPLVSFDQNWSLSGSLLAEMWLLIVLLWVWGSKLLEKVKKRDAYIKEIAITAVLVLVLFLDVFKMIRSGWGYLNLDSSWVIATESLKRLPLKGVGIGNFVEAFYWWRPATFNSSQNWSGVFGLANSAILQIWTEVGIVGLILGIFGWISAWKNQEGKKGQRVKVLLISLGLLLTPVNLIGWFLLAWLVATGSKTKETRLMLKTGEDGTNVAPVLLAVVVFGGAIWGGYWWTRVMLGEVYFRNSLVAMAKNDGVVTYSEQIRAIQTNENNAQYRQIYSQTNLALAASLLSNQELSEEDKQKASTLIQQAVREGKAAVALDSQNPSYWNNLAQIYRQLAGNLEGAADWSYQAYAQAATLNPSDPNLRLDFGGLMYAAGKYEEADRLFEQVVTLKPDLANGWYNWAYTAKQLGKLQEAVSRLSQAVALVPASSGDYEKANQELESWKKEYEAAVKKNEETQKAAETLKVPEALPTPNEKTEVNLPKSEMQPPQVSVTPTEAVTPTVVPTVMP